MKKITSTFIAVMLMVMVLFTASPAPAGPIDWVMDKFGYTPTPLYETQVIATQRALEAAKIAKVAADEAVATVELQTNIAKYGGGLILLVGGFAYFRRDKIARNILKEKTTS